MKKDDGDKTRAHGSFHSASAPRGQGRFAAGAILGDRYRIVSFLGKGGMGEVYRADDLILGQTVALKFLPREYAESADRLARFRNEVRIGRELAHPNVCRIYDIVETGGHRLLSMEYVDGEDLSSLLRRIGRLPPDKAGELARQICAGLAAAHEKGVLHRDLKPANIMLDSQGKIRITDFGLAALATTVDGDSARAGTPEYMAPEQLRGEQASRASDIYSLGLLIYELYTGRKIHNASSVKELMAIQRSGSGVSWTDAPADFDPAVKHVIERCIEHDAALRPQSALTVAAALPGGDPLAAALAAGETPSPEVVASSGQASATHPGIVAGLVALAAVLIFVAVTLTERHGIWHYAPLDKPPAALLDRAREMAKHLDTDASPRDWAWGYGYYASYLRWLLENGDADDRWRPLSQARPVSVLFWYRQSPGIYRRTSKKVGTGFVSATDPPWSIEGEIYLSLDMSGRLRRFYRVPRSQLDPPAPAAQSEAAVDYHELFRLAGLDFDEFSPAEPRMRWTFRADRRFAWTGFYPESPNTPLRIEAAEADGHLSLFRFYSPWDDPSLWDDPLVVEKNSEAKISTNSAETVTPPTLLQTVENWRRSLNTVLFIVTMGVVAVASVLTGRTLRSKRGDVRGAVRVGLFCGSITLLFTTIGTDRIDLVGRFDYLRNLGFSVFVGMGAWSGYLGAEPLVRRQYPTVLISWVRLLSGRIRDPLVGRSVLIGSVSGVLVMVLDRVQDLMPHILAPADHVPIWLNFSNAARWNVVLLEFLPSVTFSIILAFIYLLALIGIRKVIHDPRLSIVVFIATLMIFWEQSNFSSWWAVLISFAVAALWTFLYLRLGVLAVIAAMVCEHSLNHIVLTTDLSAWYRSAMLLPLAAVTAIILFGAVAALRPAPMTRSGDASLPS